MTETVKIADINILIAANYKSIITAQTKLAVIQKTKKEVSEKLASTLMDMLVNDKIKLLLQTVVVSAQTQVMTKIENIVSSALNTVYGPGHKFIMKLEQRRNQHEIDFFIDDGNVCIQLKRPFIGKGGGKVTIAALALQLAVLESTGLEGPIFLDEITKFVDIEAVNNVATMLKEYSVVSERQVINITHHEAVAAKADVKISVLKDARGVAKVKCEVNDDQTNK